MFSWEELEGEPVKGTQMASVGVPAGPVARSLAACVSDLLQVLCGSLQAAPRGLVGAGQADPAQTTATFQLCGLGQAT